MVYPHLLFLHLHKNISVAVCRSYYNSCKTFRQHSDTVSVSYTHLDVYKRQAMDHIALFFLISTGSDVSENAVISAVSTMKNQDNVWLNARLQIRQTSRDKP